MMMMMKYFPQTNSQTSHLEFKIVAANTSLTLAGESVNDIEEKLFYILERF